MLVGKTELQAQRVQNNIADIIQDGFAREMNRVVTDEAKKYCCEIDEPSQLHHECMMTGEEQLLSCHYDAAKKH